MGIYIALLKGINVGGNNLIKKTSLQQLCQKLGLMNVKTYIQSGNIVFESNGVTVNELENLLQQHIQTTFLVNTKVFVYTTTQIKTVIENNPFVNHTDYDEKNMYVTFLASQPHENLLATLQEKLQPLEQLFCFENTIYLYCPNGYGKTKVHNQTIIQKLKVEATTRNWKTTNKLLLMSEK